MTAARRVLTGVPGLVVAFLAVHAWLYWVDVHLTRLNAAGDVTIVYRAWVEQWQHGGPLVGVTTASVYPVLAIVPMIAAAVAGRAHYLSAWLLLATLLDAVSTALLARRRLGLAWWFVGFVLALGPVVTARIDAVALPLAVAGVLAVRARPALASALLTVGAWVKVWPGMLLLALVTAGRRTVRVLAAAALTSLVVVVGALAVGARPAVLVSFVAAQTSRGLQIEAPVTAPWLWAVAAGAPGAHIRYVPSLVAFQATGFGVRAAAAAMTWVLAAGVVAVLVAGVLARRRRGADEEVLALVGLGLVAAVIALNKVGSPQYCTWYVAPVLLGLLAAGRRFRTPSVLVLLLAVLTQVVYPWNYRQVLDARPAMLVVLDLRDALEVVLLAWTVLRLVRIARARTAPAAAPVPAAGPPARVAT